MKTIVRIALCTLFTCAALSYSQAQEQKPTPSPPEQTTSASATEAVKQTVTDNTKATIYFYRIKQFAGSALEPGVFVDEKEVANMDNGRYFGVTLEPGKHSFRMGDKQTGFEIDMKPGQVYYARVTIEAGFWKGHGRLTLLMPEQGAFEIKKTKLLGADKVKDRNVVTIYEGSDKTEPTSK